MRFLAGVLIMVTCVACSGGTKKELTASPTPSESSASTSACRNGPVQTPAPDANVSTTTKPTVVVPDGAPPCNLVIADIKQGTGAAVNAGGTVTVQYVGVAWSTRKQFDASWDDNGAIPLSLDQVVPGWQQGIPGMKEGGRRELIVPPAEGYGAAGRPPAIGPDETLIFVIDLIKVGS